jgi:hypothetical protein
MGPFGRYSKIASASASLKKYYLITPRVTVERVTYGLKNIV